MSTAVLNKAGGHGRAKAVKVNGHGRSPSPLPLAEIRPHEAAVVVPAAPAAPAFISVPIVAPPVDIPASAGRVALSRHFGKLDSKGGAATPCPPARPTTWPWRSAARSTANRSVIRWRAI